VGVAREARENRARKPGEEKIAGRVDSDEPAANIHPVN